MAYNNYKVDMYVECLANGNQGKRGIITEVTDYVYVEYEDYSQGKSNKPGDGLLTCEGKELFENWLFQANKDKFNTDVVQPMIADMEKECSK